jgi:hypothetical protein
LLKSFIVVHLWFGFRGILLFLEPKLKVFDVLLPLSLELDTTTVKGIHLPIALVNVGHYGRVLGLNVPGLLDKV